METPWLGGGHFERVLVVPEEILEGVQNEAPPGKLFSGRALPNTADWSPAPDGKVWIEHPYLKEPRGTYVPDQEYHLVDFFLQNGYFNNVDPNRFWQERGALAFWCPVLQRFLSEGERLRQEHWFHNGDGSAQQRYFYSQYEMLDKHGGLASLPTHVGDDDAMVTKVRTADQLLNDNLKQAEKLGKVINLD